MEKDAFCQCLKYYKNFTRDRLVIMGEVMEKVRNIFTVVALLFLVVSSGNACATNPDPPPKPQPCPTGTNCGSTTNVNSAAAIAAAAAQAAANANADAGVTIGENSLNPVAQGGAARASLQMRDSGNSSAQIDYKIPIALFTPEMIAPIVLETELYPFLSAVNGQDIDGVSVIFTDSRNIIPIRAAIAANGIKILGTQQNHGKKFLATLHSRSGEYVGPMEQVREMRRDAPDGTKCMLIGLNTITHTRGSAGVAGTGNSQDDWTSVLSANLSGSMAVPLVMTTATFLNMEMEVINCNDPVLFEQDVCKRQFKSETGAEE
jgi:hypothetical protein